MRRGLQLTDGDSSTASADDTGGGVTLDGSDVVTQALVVGLAASGDTGPRGVDTGDGARRDGGDVLGVDGGNEGRGSESVLHFDGFGFVVGKTKVSKLEERRSIQVNRG